MAIVRSAGTEILRCHSFAEVDSTLQVLIMGEQHHIYTVLSIICHAESMQAPGNFIHCYLNGYDSKAGATDEAFTIFKQDMSTQETFVFNDKFSFNGFEPTDFAGPMDNATKQNAIADQGGVAQDLRIYTDNAADDVDVMITFIDQNNA